MKQPRLTGLVAVVGVLCMLGLPLLAQGNDNHKRRHFKAHLKGFNETPSISTNGEGDFRLEINHDDTAIDFTLSYENLTGDPAVAHIHLGQRHTAGGVSAFFCGGGGKPPCPAQPARITGTIDAAGVIGPAGQGIAPGELAELIRAIRAGATYANVHTASFPAGEIRGQIDRGHD
jgi:hypothetical protein